MLTDSALNIISAPIIKTWQCESLMLYAVIQRKNDTTTTTTTTTTATATTTTTTTATATATNDDDDNNNNLNNKRRLDSAV
jgi:hypothetical protein